jgi:hypothetical protein
MKRSKPHHLFFAFAITALFGAGCAVMTIDVDVYKGPLANSEEVQLEQLTVMANSAKPLLIALKDELQQADSDFSGTSHGSSPAMRPASLITNWIDPILSLYNDRSSPEFSSFDDRAGAILRQYTLQSRILNPTNEDLTVQQHLAQALLPYQRETNGILIGFSAYLNSAYKVPTSIFVPAKIALDQGRHLTGKWPDSVPPYTQWADYSITAEFRWLENAEFVEQLLDLDASSIEIAPNLRRSIVETVSENARAYARCRRALQELYQLELDFVSNASFSRTDRTNDLRLLPDFARCLAEMTSPKRLRFVFAATNFIPGSQRFQERLLFHLAHRSGDAVTNNTTFWSGKDEQANESLVRALKSVILEEPVSSAAFLSQAHDILPREILTPEQGFTRDFSLPKSSPEGDATLWPEVFRKEDGLYGLPKGPVHYGSPVNAHITPETLASWMGSVLQGAGAFERGRQVLGLDSLVERYLEYYSIDRSSAETQARADFLMRELVYFSERTLFMANNIILLQRGDQTEKLARILQSIGNAILSQVDEVHQRRNYAERQQINTPAALQAYREAMTLDSLVVLNGHIDSLATKLSAISSNVAQKAESYREAFQAATSATNAVTKAKDYVDTMALLLESINRDQQSAFSAISGSTSPKALLVSYLSFVQGASQSTEGDREKARQLKAFLPDYAKGVSDNTSAKDQAITELKAILQKDSNSAWDSWKTEEEKRDKLVVKLEQAKNDKAEAENAEKTAQSIVDELRGRTPGVAQRVQSLQLTASDSGVIVLADTLQTDLSTQKTSSKSEDQKTEEEKKADRQAEDKRKLLQKALAEVKSWPHSGPGKSLAAAANAQRPAEVWTVFISQLEFERAEAYRNGQSATAASIENALRVALQHRADLAYLRPASTFLRNSYLVSSFQTGNKLAWKNTLAQQGRRQLPFAASLSENNPKDIRTIAEIDKQFWQNINQVRVAGGGNSNYILAKDDVGNWYVKEYSTDPKQVIESMQKLATFAIGPAVGASGAFALSTRTNSSDPLTQSPYRTQYNLFTTNFVNATTNLYADAAEKLEPDKIKQKLVASWKDASADIKKVAEDAGTSLVALPKSPKTPKDAADALFKSANGICNYYEAVTTALNGSEAGKGFTNQTLQTLAPIVKDLAERRAAILSSYENAVGVIRTSVVQ